MGGLVPKNTGFGVLNPKHFLGRLFNLSLSSSRKCDFRDEGRAIFPKAPEQRVEAKFWMDFISKRIISFFFRFLKAWKAGKDRDESKAYMLKGMDVFTQAMSFPWPFFMGDQCSAVDIAFAPFAYRIDLLLTHCHSFRLFDNLQYDSRYRRWYPAVSVEPAFVQSHLGQLNYESRLIDFYLPCSLGGGQEDVARRARGGILKGAFRNTK